MSLTLMHPALLNPFFSRKVGLIPALFLLVFLSHPLSAQMVRNGWSITPGTTWLVGQEFAGLAPGIDLEIAGSSTGPPFSYGGLRLRVARGELKDHIITYYDQSLSQYVEMTVSLAPMWVISLNSTGHYRINQGLRRGGVYMPISFGLSVIGGAVPEGIPDSLSRIWKFVDHTPIGGFGLNVEGGLGWELTLGDFHSIRFSTTTSLHLLVTRFSGIPILDTDIEFGGALGLHLGVGYQWWQYDVK